MVAQREALWRLHLSKHCQAGGRGRLPGGHHPQTHDGTAGGVGTHASGP